MKRRMLAGGIAVLALAAAAPDGWAQESVGRYQALMVPRAGGDASLVLIDTATGRTWILGSAPGAGGKSETRWQVLRFLTPEVGPAQANDPLYPNATAPDASTPRGGVLRRDKPIN